MRIFVVDAFTKKPFSGNPAAVCLLESDMDVKVMQNIATEMRHSETCFTKRISDHEYSIRWFTPTNEVELCGHGTMATAHVIFHVDPKIESITEVVFHTVKGLQLKVTHNVDTDTLSMSFPCYKPKEVIDSSDKVALRKFIDPIIYKHLTSTVKEEVKSIYWSSDTKKLFFVLAKNFDLKTLCVTKNDMEKWMTTTSPYPVRGICLTKEGNDLGDIQMRYFSPWNGIGEDPVNGSSHTVLGPLWKYRFSNTISVFHSEICSARSGSMTVTVANDDSSVELLGSAVIVLSGELHV